jgi:hypothetical protein
MYALIINGIAVRYPYAPDNLRIDNPQVSFPAVIPDQVQADYGMVPVVVQAQPDYDPRTQRVESANLPVLVDGVWTITKTVVNKTQEQIDADTANKSADVRRKRTELLKASDWTQVLDAPVDRTAWATYRQGLRDVTNQPGFPWEVTWPDQPEA